MHNTARGSLHRHVHNSNISSALFRWEVEQPAAADRGRKWRIKSDAEIRWFCLQHPDTAVRFYLPQTILKSSTVSSTCVIPLFHWVICLIFVFHFCICHVLEASSTPPLTGGESSGSPAGFSHWFLLDFYWHYTRRVEIVCRNCGASHASHTFALHLLRRKYGGTAESSAYLKVASLTLTSWAEFPKLICKY